MQPAHNIVPPEQLTRANTTSTTRDRRSPGPGHPHGAHGHANGQAPKTSKAEPGPERSSPGAADRERRPQQPAQPSPAAASLQKAAAAGGATPRRREKKEKDAAKEADIVKRLQQICTDADPTKLYRNLVKIGAGYVSRIRHIYGALF